MANRVRILKSSVKIFKQFTKNKKKKSREELVNGERLTRSLLLHVWLAHTMKPKSWNICWWEFKYIFCWSPAEPLQVPILFVLQQHVVEPCFVFWVVRKGQTIACHGWPGPDLQRTKNPDHLGKFWQSSNPWPGAVCTRHPGRRDSSELSRHK